MANIDIGNKTEKELCDKLSQAGFWVHNFARGKGGNQPCDIIAIIGYSGKTVFREWLLDAKHSKDKIFNFSRIEANQDTCFKLAYETCRIECGFAIEYNNEWYYMSYKFYKAKKLRKFVAVDITTLRKLDTMIYE